MTMRNHFPVIDATMINRQLFYPLAAVGNISASLLIHPVFVVRCRVISRTSRPIYGGLIGTMKTIVAKEGVSSLYQGFGTRSLQVMASLCYVSSYETLRAKLSVVNSDATLRSSVAGATANVIRRVLSVPSDVVSQHLMLINNKDLLANDQRSIKLDQKQMRSSASRFIGICRGIYKQHGVFGFYRGFLLEIVSSTPCSACWWAVYNLSCDRISSYDASSAHVPRLAIQFMAGSLASVVSATVVNFIDVIKIRTQISGSSMRDSAIGLWREDRWRNVQHRCLRDFEGVLPVGRITSTVCHCIDQVLRQLQSVLPSIIVQNVWPQNRMSTTRNFQVIESDMLKTKFYPLSTLGNMSASLVLQPLSVVRTRMIMQRHNTIYTGSIMALQTMMAKEGPRSLFKGYGTKTFQVVPGILYVSTYENVRSELSKYVGSSNHWRSFLAGGLSSVLHKSLSVPTDVVSQHLMLLSTEDPRANGLTRMKLSPTEMTTSFNRFKAVCSKLYSGNGIRGFYSGFGLQILSSVPSNATWWGIYNVCCDRMQSSDRWAHINRSGINFISGTIASVVSATAFNMVDVVKIRIQVTDQSMGNAVRTLWEEERFRLPLKGLSTRVLLTWGICTYCIMVYESLKIYCLKDQYKPLFRFGLNFGTFYDRQR